MKKILFLVLVIGVILSGCSSGALPKSSHNSVPNSELAESLIARTQNNIDTDTFEGFTGESTIGDVYIQESGRPAGAPAFIAAVINYQPS